MMEDVKNDLEKVKTRVDGHTIDIVNLQNDFKHLGQNVHDLVNEVTTLSTNLAHLDKTVSKADASFNTIGKALKFLSAILSAVGVVVGIYIATH